PNRPPRRSSLLPRRLAGETDRESGRDGFGEREDDRRSREQRPPPADNLGDVIRRAAHKVIHQSEDERSRQRDRNDPGPRPPGSGPGRMTTTRNRLAAKPSGTRAPMCAAPWTRHTAK